MLTVEPTFADSNLEIWKRSDLPCILTPLYRKAKLVSVVCDHTSLVFIVAKFHIATDASNFTKVNSLRYVKCAACAQRNSVGLQVLILGICKSTYDSTDQT